MNDQSSLPLHALPDGEAELRVVLRLRWEDVAALGQEAGRLAAHLQRPVSLDEAASHRLRSRSAAPSRGGQESSGSPAPKNGQENLGPTAVQSTPDRGRPPLPPSAPTAGTQSPIEQARQAIDKINGSAPTAAPQPAPAASTSSPQDARAGAERVNGAARQ
ncbi:hypothetical protein ABT112_19790 [Streptomyces sp. NPDC002055]|uniref:hypothetical protein n=1 Tax=Streptomyces sp. NPDC002055 TaxID=3154534 RepID=UPI0033229844